MASATTRKLTRKYAWQLEPGDRLPLPDGRELIVKDSRATANETMFIDWGDQEWTGECHPTSEWYVH